MSEITLSDIAKLLYEENKKHSHNYALLLNKLDAIQHRNVELQTNVERLSKKIDEFYIEVRNAERRLIHLESEMSNIKEDINDNKALKLASFGFLGSFLLWVITSVGWLIEKGIFGWFIDR